MAPKINKQLLPLKVHYFLKYGGMSFFPFLPALIRQKGVSEGGVGLIWTVIPLTSAALNMLVGTVADYFKIHRAFFMSGMIVITATFTSVFFMPDVPGPSPDSVLTMLSLQCPVDHAEFVVCPSSGQPSSDIALPIFSQCENYTMFAEENSRLEYELQCKVYNNPNGITEQTPNFPSEFTLSFDSDQSGYNVCSSRNCTVITEVNVTNTFSEQYNVSCGDDYKTTCEYQCQTSVFHQAHVTIKYLLNSSEFWMIFINMMILYGGNGITTTMADTVCFFLLGKNRHKYGHQRLWGSLAWGMIGMSSGAIVNAVSKIKGETDYTPVVAISLSFLTANLIVSFFIKFDVPKKEKLKASVVGNTLCSFKMIIFLVTIAIGGMTMGIQWTFYYIVVEDVALAWDAKFQYVKLIQGLLLGIDCFFGEVPFLFLSSYVIKRLGNVRTFSGILIILTIRCFLYSAVTNPWYFLPIEFLHGPSFGLMYPNMITYANALAPKGAQATIQGIVKSTFIGGVSLGGLVGGILLEKTGGSKTYLYLAVFNFTFTILFHIINFVRSKMKAEHSRNEAEGNRYDVDTGNDDQEGLHLNNDEMPLNSEKEPQSISPLSNGSSKSNQPTDDAKQHLTG